MFFIHFRARQSGAPASLRRLAQMLATSAAVAAGCGASRAVAEPSLPAADGLSGSRTRVSAVAPDPPTSRRPNQIPPSWDRPLAAERALAEEASLPEILRVALAQSPELAEARERERAERARAPAASRLPDPEFEYQLWAQPLARPYALDRAQMHMFGIRQSFPAPGTRSAEAEAAWARSAVALETRRARAQDLAARVRRVYAEYYRADRQYRIHLDHVGLAQQVLDAARAAYQGGRGTQQDVLRTAVELSRLHNDVAVIDRDRRTARGLLNTLMARPTEAPLGPPKAIEPAAANVRAAELEQALSERRPEIAAAKSAIRVRESELDAARQAARWPGFMVGIQYMYMPPEADRHNYGIMFSMSLPWLNPKYGEQIRAAEATLAAERSALSNARYGAGYELYEALERLKAARESLAVIERDLLPQAQLSFESAQATYRGGQSDSLGVLDALRSLFDSRLERERALALVDTALADVERAAGAEVTASQTLERE